MSQFRLLPLFLGCGALLCWSASAAAQSPALALDRLQPAPAGDPFFGVESASPGAAGRLSAGLLASYARDPLVYKLGDTETSVIRYQAIAHLGIAWEPTSRWKLDVALPMTFAQGGRQMTAGSYALSAPDSQSVGQTRLGARVVLSPQSGAIPAVALSMRVFLPRATSDDFAGSESLRYTPAITIGGAYPRWLWSASLSRLVRSESDSHADLAGSEVGLAGAVALRSGPWQIGPEWWAATVADGRTHAFRRATTSTEVLLGARYAFGPLTFMLAGGPGLARGVGTPSYRLVAGVSFSTEAPASSTTASSHESSFDDLVHPEQPARSVARTSAEPRATVVVDRDADGVVDLEDGCPEVAGDPAAAAPKRGCPADQDGDGIADGDDRCPTAAGASNPDPAKHGCPKDTDGDGIADGQDACVQEKGPATQDPKTNGCPTAARVLGPQIVIQEQILFETGSDRILEQSVHVLQSVADVMLGHPDIARIAVDGHTDNVGVDGKNLQLSQRRSLAIVRWLVDHGIDARRLETRAFGARRPIADNKTPEGRAKNRRVEFLIRKRTVDGEAGWKDGPVD